MNKAYVTGAYIPGCRINKHPAVGRIVGNSRGSGANNIYSPGSDKLTEVQVYMSASCQPGSRIIRAISNVEKPFLIFLIWWLKRLFNVRGDTA